MTRPHRRTELPILVQPSIRQTSRMYTSKPAGYMNLHRVVPLITAVALAACGIPSIDTNGNGADNGPLALPSTNIVDLTHHFNEETINWPTEVGFRRLVTAEGITAQGYYYEAGRFSSSEHGGTHIDAPIHFSEGGNTVDEVPLDQLMGTAVVIDVTEPASENPDYRITIEDIQSWESENSPIPDGAVVLFRTGFSQYWPDAERYLGTTQTGPLAVAELHFPGLHPDAAAWLLENRSIKAVGIDTPSIDYGQSQVFHTHRTLFDENVPAFENVANLEQVPTRGAIVVALPMKIDRGSGAPLRIIAFIP